MGTEEEMGQHLQWDSHLLDTSKILVPGPSSRTLRKQASCVPSNLIFPMALQRLESFPFYKLWVLSQKQYQTLASCSLLSAQRLGACWHTIGVE